MEALTKTEKIEQAVIDWARETEFTLALVKTQPVQDGAGGWHDGAIAAMVSKDLGGSAHVTNLTLLVDGSTVRVLGMKAVA